MLVDVCCVDRQRNDEAAVVSDVLHHFCEYPDHSFCQHQRDQISKVFISIQLKLFEGHFRTGICSTRHQPGEP